MSSSGTLAIANFTSPYELSVIAAPYATATPTNIAITGGAIPNGGITFDSSGNLWVGLNTGYLQKYTAPFSAGESPAANIAGNYPAQLTGDTNGDVFALEASGSIILYGPSGTPVTTITPPTSARAMVYVP